MLIKDAILLMRDKVNDKDVIEYEDDELLTNLQEAIQYISAYLISVNSHLAVKDLIVKEKSFELPKNYTKSAGNYPIKISGNTAELLDRPPLKFRYFETVKDLTEEDEMPYNHEALWQIMIKLAAIYALNRNEFNIQQDKALLDEVNQQLAAIVA